MSGGLSFCQGANQSLPVLGTVVGKGSQNDVELNRSVTQLKEIGLLEKDVNFANRMELGESLIVLQDEFKTGSRVLNEKQMTALDKALDVIIGRRLCS